MLEELPQGQENRLSLIFRDTLMIRFCSPDRSDLRQKCIGRFMSYASLSVTDKISPNLMELLKMIANSMALLASNEPLKTVLGLDGREAGDGSM